MMAATTVSTLYIGGPLGCGSTATGASGGGTTDGESELSALGQTFPTDLAIASPTAEQDTVSALIISERPKAVDLEADATMEAKQEAIAELLSDSVDAVADCDFTLDLAINTNNATCYGPALTYSNHPDLVGPGDSDTTNNDSGLNDTDGDGSLPTGDVGLWTANNGSTSEACAAAQMNAKVSGIAGQVDSAMLAMASMYCLANVNGSELPDTAGESLDLTTVVNSGFSTNGVGITVTSATLERDDDDADGNTVYIASLQGTATQDSNTYTVDFRLKHIPTGDENATYKGKLSYTVDDADASSQGCDPGDGVIYATSIDYDKSSATSLTYKLHNGTFCGDVDPYVSATDHTIDPSNTWSGNFNKVLFNYNPATAVGNYSFAWQAGFNDSHARVMNMSIAQASGETTGTAFFGYGPQVDETDAGDIDGMICNWAGPGNNHTTGLVTKVQQQEIALDDTSGLFEAASSDITYAPTNNCNSTGTGQGGTFTYSDGTTTVSTSVTNDLVDLSVVEDAYTEPTAPENVDE